MNKTLALLFLFGSILMHSCYRPSSKQAFEDLKSMEGMWNSYEGPDFSESWTIINDSLMHGIGYSINNKDTAFKEYLQIKRVSDSIFYGALTADHGEFVFFKLKEAHFNKWKFINHENEYPNIITYELTNNEKLIATISNIRGNKKIEFKLRRSTE